MMRPAFLLFAFVVFLGSLPSAQAAQTIVRLVDSHGATYLYPGSSLSVVKDPTRSMTIEAVATSPDFVPMHPTNDVNAAYWIRLTYTTAGTTKKWLLFLGYKAETADLYVREADGAYSVTHSGIAVAYARRPVRVYGGIYFRLPPAPKPRTLYVRVTTREPELTIAIDSQGTVDAVSKVTLAIIIGLDSIIASLLISSLVFFATSRDKTYLLYALYIAMELIYRTDDQGLAAALFWPHVGISSLRLGALFDGARIVAATIFLRAFLHLRAVSTLLDRINVVFAAIFGLLAVASFANLPVRASWLAELSLVYVPLWLVSSLVAWRRGEKQALLIAIGWSLLMLFSVSFGLKQLGFARGNLFVELLISQGRNLGVALQTLFLSLAISTDIRRLMRSRQYYESLAATDPLTGLANRRTFEETLEREMQRATRAASPLSLLVLDVDHFKEFNDLCGHAAGDAALRFVSERAATAMRRPGDLLCRYGGDEFITILPDTDEAAAMGVAKRMHAAIAEKQVANPGSPLGLLTTSIGVATLRSTEGRAPAELFEQADRALYCAKQRGRNCCSIDDTLAILDT
ncbi:MAG TPA: diguanylate cyclase [Candidatus Baltobacteraceae bacterium]|nr:diguanylate cyclase [Candidatus Baltobacteraceae bacterium]